MLGGAGVAIANQVFYQDPSARWCWGQPCVLEPPKRQVALESALRKGSSAHAPGGARSALRKGWAAEALAVLALAAPGARFP